MYNKEELESIFENAVSHITENLNMTNFTIDLEHIGIVNDKYLNLSMFELWNTGLLELVLLVDGSIIEYHKKIKNLEDLKYAVLHLDEWEDDWNED